nr:hypothetical protein Iba_chr02fCG6100 [Ipomoea batatas]
MKFHRTVHEGKIEEIKNRKRRRGSHRQEQCKSSKERSRKGVTGKSVGENRKTAATETKTMNERESCERKSGGRSEGLTLHRRGLRAFHYSQCWCLLRLSAICVNFTETVDNVKRVDP